MEHMTLIPKPKESAFWQYTRRTIAKRRASAGMEDQQQQSMSSPGHGVQSHSPSPDRKSRIPGRPPETLKYMSLSSAKLPPGASKKLCEIFSAISSVERSKQVFSSEISLYTYAWSLYCSVKFFLHYMTCSVMFLWTICCVVAWQIIDKWLN